MHASCGASKFSMMSSEKSIVRGSDEMLACKLRETISCAYLRTLAWETREK